MFRSTSEGFQVTRVHGNQNVADREDVADRGMAIAFIPPVWSCCFLERSLHLDPHP
ncbi:MAG: hypothetical protein WBA43_13590 [Elainellaceae cyanobacterium]